MPASAIIGILGLVITFSVFISQVVFKLGHHSARLEELEKWRGSIREDMHEISEKLEILNQNMKTLTTLIEERTERRIAPRA
jgi:hypothetical protein